MDIILDSESVLDTEYDLDSEYALDLENVPATLVVLYKLQSLYFIYSC